jgi:hypothetical protein
MAKRQPISAVSPDASMSLMDAIRHRHAVRSFAHQAVDKSAINTLLEAAVRAPTAVHEEPWAFAIIQDKATLKRLSDKAKEGMNEMEQSLHVPGRHPSSHFVPPENIFYDAGSLIPIAFATCKPRQGCCLLRCDFCITLRSFFMSQTSPDSSAPQPRACGLRSGACTASPLRASYVRALRQSRPGLRRSSPARTRLYDADHGTESL